MGDSNDHDNDGNDDSVDTDVNDTDVDETEDESDTSKNTDDNDADDDSDDGSDDDSAEDGEDDDGKGDSDDDESSDAADDDDTDDDADDDQDDGDDPELRKPKAGASNKEWAAWRAQEKAKAKNKDDDGSGKSDDDDDGEDTDDDKSGNKDAVAKEVAKQLAPLHKQQQEQEVDTEIATFLGKNPDFKKFETKVRRWANHPNRAGVPVKAIFYEVAGDKLMSIGAKRGKAADKKANKTKTTGGQNAGDEGSKSFKDMPLDEFGKVLETEKLKR